MQRDLPKPACLFHCSQEAANKHSTHNSTYHSIPGLVSETHNVTMSDLDEGPQFVMASEAPAHHPSYLFNTYFNDPTSSDLIIKLSDDKILHAHRIILCRRSSYFAKLLGGSFKVSVARTSNASKSELTCRPGKQLQANRTSRRLS
jgi:hypothetical protein